MNFNDATCPQRVFSSVTDADCDLNDPLTNTDLAISGGTTLTNNQFQKNVGVGGVLTYTGIGPFFYSGRIPTCNLCSSR